MPLEIEAELESRKQQNRDSIQTEIVSIVSFEKITRNDKGEMIVTLKIVGAPDYVLNDDHECLVRELNELLADRKQSA